MTFPYIPLTVDRFLNVRSDAKYGRYLDATEVTHWISGLPGVTRSGSNRFSGSVGGAPLQLIVVQCDARGNWAGGGTTGRQSTSSSCAVTTRMTPYVRATKRSPS